MYIKVVAFVLSVSGFLTGALVALYSFTHDFPYRVFLGVWESFITVIFACAVYLISYDVKASYRESGDDDE